MPEVTANGITLHYDERGDAGAPPMLMIMGLGAQMTLWPDELLDALAERGFRVIRFDNRDIGLSQKMEDARTHGIVKMLIFNKLGLPLRVDYSLSDMADDAMGLADALEIDKAHVVGASMGGMIAQHVALKYPDRLLSLTSVMSTTGHRKLPQAKPKALKALASRPRSLDEETLVEHGLDIIEAVGSPGFRPDPERARQRVLTNVRRSIYPKGFLRQTAAILHDGDRRERLKSLNVPTLVLHGEDDPLIPVEHGRDTAAHIPGSKLQTIPGWGHDLPLQLVEELADAIATHAWGATG